MKPDERGWYKGTKGLKTGVSIPDDVKNVPGSRRLTGGSWSDKGNFFR